MTGGKTDDMERDSVAAGTSARSKGVSLTAKMFSVTLGVVLLALIILFVYIVNSFQQSLAPEIDKKMTTVGRSVKAQMERALGYGIPLEKLQGMPEFLDPLLEDNPEIGYFVVSDAAGAPLHFRGKAADHAVAELKKNPMPGAKAARDAVAGFINTKLDIEAKNEVAGSVQLGVSKEFVQESLAEIKYDVLTVTFVALLVAYEFLVILIGLKVNRPVEMLGNLMKRVQKGDFRHTILVTSSDEVSTLTESINAVTKRMNEMYNHLQEEAQKVVSSVRDPEAVAKVRDAVDRLKKRFTFAGTDRRRALLSTSIDNVKAPLFIFVFAEEMSRSFLPIYINQLYEPVFGLAREVVISIPISIFMAFVAVSTPVAGGWVDRIRSRRVFLLGLIPAIAGHVGAGLARGLYDLILWRSLSAVGYAMIVVASLGYIARNTKETERARGMAAFVSTIMISAICGTSIGAVMAERIGFRLTFGLAVVLAVISGLLAYSTLVEERRTPSEGEDTPKAQTWKTLFALTRNGRFTFLMLGAAIPAKLMLTGFLFFLAPLYLVQLGAMQSAVGRVMMVYFAIMAVMTPLVATLVDKVGKRFLFVVLGGLISGAGVMVVLLQADLIGMLLGVAAFGVGQALAVSPLIALVIEVSERECERFGQTSVLGIFRVLERVGSVAGPFVVAAMVARFGYPQATVGSGFIMLVSTAILILAFMVFKGQPKHQTGESR